MSILEKIGYSLGDLAANLVFQTLVTYLAYFYTDIYHLAPAHSSVIILAVGLVAAFGFNPIIGALADRTQSRWGKFRPWILFTAIPLGVIAVLAFTTPHFSYKGKVIYAVVTYSLLLLLYAANNLPYSALSGVITGDMKERNSLSAYRFVAVMFAQFFVQAFMLSIIETAGGGNKAIGIEKVMTWLAVIGAGMLLITFFTTRERIVPKPEQKSSLKEDLGDLFRNKPWVIMLVLTTMIFITLAMKGGAYVYYFQNYVDKDSLTRVMTPVITTLTIFGKDPVSASFGLFNAGGIIFMIVGITFSKRLADKYGKRDVYGIGLFLSTAFLLVFFFFPPNAIALIFLSQILHGFFYGITIPLLWAMIADVADYSEWKNNRRATAIIFSAMMVGLKAGLSIGSALLTWILGLYHYAPNSAVQTEGAIQGTKLLVSIYPSIPFLIGAALLFFYEIDKKMEVKIEGDLKDRRTSSRESARSEGQANTGPQHLVKHIYTADPSAHVFNGKIYIYPSHDIENDIPFDDLGSHFAMEDYHVLSMDSPNGETTDHGIALHVKDVPWAEKQLWAPDATTKDGKYYLYFPAKRSDGIFQIGVAVSDSPTGPFIPQPEAIRNSFSIDPAVFTDDDGKVYLYFGGIWGGQLQRWRTGSFDASEPGPYSHLPAEHDHALTAKVARLTNDMLQFDETPKDVVILDENGNPLLQGDNNRRFFEASWMHKYNGKYYFSYSTGDTHYICYAIGDNPYGPFTYKGILLHPVIGWTNHHSIVEFKGKWWLFYHDSSLSDGVTHLRSVKVTELTYNSDGTIKEIYPYQK